jgi:hypothetical protein
VRLILMIEVAGFFALLLLQTIWGIRGTLTERRFALLPTLALGLIMLTAGLSVASSSYLFGIVALIIATTLSCALVYLLLRYTYRQSFRSK